MSDMEDSNGRVTPLAAGVSSSRDLDHEGAAMPKTYTPTSAQLYVDTVGGPMPDTAARAPAGEPPAATPEPIIPVRRRTIDTVLVAAGTVVAVVLAVAGGLLMWGNRFADDYVERELGSQNVTFPDAAALEAEGRTDLLGYAGEQVTTGAEAEAYASYIGGHLDGIADGATYADLGGPEREANAAVQEAVDSGADQATIDELQATADEITAQRNTLFKGETLRGQLLSTYAWSTIGQIAGIAAVVAFVGAGLMAILVVLGLIHRRKTA
jgi:hypothetical protein